jgi:hypothetical protein
MSAEAATYQYMLLFRGTHWDKGLSPEDIQNVLSRWTAWFDGLTQQGKAKLGQPLMNDARIVSGRKGQNVVDGPFKESKEAVAGYILLRVADIEEATEIAKQCPGLDTDMSVEIRPINEDMGRGPA